MVHRVALHVVQIVPVIVHLVRALVQDVRTLVQDVLVVVVIVVLDLPLDNLLEEALEGVVLVLVVPDVLVVVVEDAQVGAWVDVKVVVAAVVHKFLNNKEVIL